MLNAIEDINDERS